mmetsp:Transcript_35059/g.99382  ORF Transcript_35059/g.99382 Transcript_35059/m.99382 type:complete len:1266 (-) Transcript_35059:109-3906(-)
MGSTAVLDMSCSAVKGKVLREASPYAPRPLPLRLDVAPFAALYALLVTATVTSWMGGLGLYFKVALACLLLTAVGHVLLLLFEQWLVSVRCYVAFTRLPSLENATVVKAVPHENYGHTELCPVFVTAQAGEDGASGVTFEYRKIRFVHCPKEGTWRRLKYTTKEPLATWAKCSGYGNASKVADALELWGPNAFQVPVPSFYELLQDQMLAPFFVFQVFCVLLWCMDEYVYYSLFTLLMLVVFESTVVQTRLRDLNELRSLQAPKQFIQVYRGGKWERLPGECLLPGDIISIVRPSGFDEGEHVVPADCLLLQGSCICEEAVLTGESTPQWKVAICGSSEDGGGGVAEREPQRLLSMKHDKQHILFGGTRILQHSRVKGQIRIKTPDSGCLAVVLRTGFDTAQGQLMRTILYSKERLTANTAETGLFICLLLVFALAASAYVMYYGLQDQERSRYKLLLNCTMIITSVIPPELPMELTIAVNQSIVALHGMGIFCTEPFRIPFAGKVDTCCFDKTGTLTSNDLVFEGLLLSADVHVVAGKEEADEPRLTTNMKSSVPVEVSRVMAACQSLVVVGGEMVGDPLEKAAFSAIGWSHAGDLVASGKALPSELREKVQILHRFHFSSALKRMSAIVRAEADSNGAVSHWVVAKGAPEVLLPLLASSQGGPRYVASYKRFASRGARVIALAYKRLGGEMPDSSLRTISRDAAESGLMLAGLAVFTCPVKPRSEPTLRMLKAANHSLVMITGDAPLTACHVAVSVHIVDRPVLILARKDFPEALAPHSGHGDTKAAAAQSEQAGSKCLPDSEFEWVSPDESVREPFSRERRDIAALAVTHDLCLPGDGITHAGLAGCLDTLVPLTQVFARTSPDQKELIIATLNKAGRVTLMCGDGTNDVGSLKASHIGVALLSASIVPGRRNKGVKAAARSRKPSPPMLATDSVVASKKGSKSYRKTTSEAATLGSASKMISQLESQGAQVSEKTAKMSAWLDSLEAASESGIIKPGDASMAAPFSAREPSVGPVCDIVRQGRSTLVTTLQMFKILGLMSLTSAYSMSILYFEGIKTGDFQATCLGLLSTALFFMLSASQPLRTLSSARPHSNVFSAYVLLSLLGQFVVHVGFLVVSYSAAAAEMPAEARLQSESEFSPNLVNTAIYLCSVAMQGTTFAVNYIGHPFNVSITQNKKMLYVLIFTAGAFLVAVFELMPDVNESFELVPLPNSVRLYLLGGAALDFVLTMAIETGARASFPAKLPPSKAKQAQAMLGRKLKAQ